MDRAGYQSLPLTTDELDSIFTSVASCHGQRQALAYLPGRNRTTLNRACRVAEEFERRGFRTLDNAMAEQIATAAKYSTTSSYVQKLFLSWKAWKEKESREKPQYVPSVPQPELTIDFDPRRLEDLGHKTLDGKPWQVACARVENTGQAVAKGCLAQLSLERDGATITGSRGPFHLNPVDEPFTLQRDTAIFVDIPPNTHRSWDLVFAPPEEGELVSAMTSGPVYAATVPVDVRARPPDEMDWTKGGACIAIPIALTRRGVPQAHLVPGEYSAKLKVRDASGNEVKGVFRIWAPHRGEKLRVGLDTLPEKVDSGPLYTALGRKDAAV